MFQKVFEYAGPHKKGLYAATAIVLVSVLMGVLPFVLAYQVIAPLVMGESIGASFIISRVALVLACLVLQALFYGWGLNLSHKAAYDTLLRLRTALQKRFEYQPFRVQQFGFDDCPCELFCRHAVVTEKTAGCKGSRPKHTQPSGYLFPGIFPGEEIDPKGCQDRQYRK